MTSGDTSHRRVAVADTAGGETADRIDATADEESVVVGDDVRDVGDAVVAEDKPDLTTNSKSVERINSTTSTTTMTIIIIITTSFLLLKRSKY